MKARWQYLQSRLAHIKEKKLFELFVAVVIIASALLIGAKTYDGIDRFSPVLYWLDISITAFFLLEISIRLAAEKRLLDFFKSGWNLFDFVIVTASLIPIDESELVLVARLLRILRVLRLISLIPELRILLSALIKSIPRMGYVALVMFIIFYIYGAIGSFLFADVDEKLWGNIAIAMLTLFQVATFESWATAVLYPTMEHHPYSWVYFLSFIFFNAFIFLNMMIGIVLDVMQKESQAIQLETGTGEAAEIHHTYEQIVALSDQINRIEAKLDRFNR
ncbi:ion transporter [Ostreibacterium oceani]|uniref:Ion transporter n=1 Tax=Ostreibacterium oceani TaxID=2654998 RepID=A0A6N7EW44_9GAMM|nr:ion transporter [Ostreibacterium oceani]MPV86984.1 ion transporter [Ostreibacterium oceani]